MDHLQQNNISEIFAARAAAIAAIENPWEPERESTRELWSDLMHEYLCLTDPAYLEKVLDAEEQALELELSAEIGADYWS